MKLLAILLVGFLLVGTVNAQELKIERVTQINFERLPVSNVNMFSVLHGASFTLDKFEFRPMIGIITFRELRSTAFTFKFTFEFKG